MFRSFLPCLLLLAATLGCTQNPDAQTATAAPAGSASAPTAAVAGKKPLAEPGTDWTGWRGPNHDGISSETAWQSKWPEGGPPKLWTAEVGTGFSSVSIAAGRLYTMGHAGDDDTVFCLDAKTGKEIWKHTYACDLFDNLHDGGPACTPTIDDERVYTVSKGGHVFCLGAATGDVVWKLELKELLEVDDPEWGFSCSPLVVGEKLIIETGYTIALDKRSGELIWKTDKYKPGYGSPTLWKTGGEELLSVLNNECLLIVRLGDGTKVDSFPWETQYETSSVTPIVSGDTVFISTGYNRGCTLLRLVDGKLEQVYENKNVRNHMNNCVLWNGYLYGIDGNSHNARVCTVVCLDFTTGERKWLHRELGCGSLLVAGGKLIVLSDEGELVVAPATPDGFKPIAQAEVIEGRCWTVPVLSHGLIYCRTAAGKLVCLDVRN